jgi:hypothetical protein
MSGRIHIENPAEHVAWVTAHTPVTATAAAATEGTH